MKKTILLTSLCGLILLLLTSCSEAKDYSDTYNPDTDYQYFLMEQAHTIQSGVSDTGYYFLNNNYIYYMDKSTMKPVLLDNRPDSDCLQKTSSASVANCNAYVSNIDGMYAGFLAYNDHKLYVIESSQVLVKDRAVTRYSLIRLSLDGTKRKKIIEFEFRPLAIAIHRGTVYYSSQDFSANSDGKYQVFKYDLNKRFAKPKRIYLGNLKNGNISDILAYGKNVYFFEFGPNMYRTLRYDIKDKSVTPMFREDSKANSTIGGILDKHLIYTKFYGDAQDKRSWVPYESDLQGGHERALPIQRDFLSYFYASDKYIYSHTVVGYLTPDQAKNKANVYQMTVYDTAKYQPVGTIDLSSLPKNFISIVGDDRYMFVRYPKENSSVIAYLDKKKITQGKAVFNTLIETPNPGPSLTRVEDK